MPQTRNCDVQSVDRTGGGIVVSFTDGRSALFSSELLYSILDQAQEIPEEPEDEAK
jgi:hypothetical protein